MSIYPDRANTHINITAPNKIEEINIFSIDGYLVKHLKGNSTTIDVSELVKGTYIITIKSENGFTKNRFIKE